MEQGLAFVLLLALGAALWWFAGVPVRPARGIGPLAGKPTDPAGTSRGTRGVGRFARPRNHPPGRQPPS